MLNYKPWALCIIASALVSSCNTLDSIQSNNDKTQTINKHQGILHSAQGTVQEVCPQLNKGQTLNFSFTSNLTTLFNAHYHEQDKVSYPVKKQLSSSLEGTFKAPFDRTYCLMWRAIQNNTKIKYEYKITE